MRTNELSHESLVSDPALREEVSAVQLELQRQILALQHEQHLQQQILLQHFQLQQKHLQQQHDQQLADRIRVRQLFWLPILSHEHNDKEHLKIVQSVPITSSLI